MTKIFTLVFDCVTNIFELIRKRGQFNNFSLLMSCVPVDPYVNLLFYLYQDRMHQSRGETIHIKRGIFVTSSLEVENEPKATMTLSCH